MQKCVELLRRFHSSTDGNVILTSAIAAPVLIGAAAYAVNMNALSDSHLELQTQLDTAVLNIASDNDLSSDIDYTDDVHEVMIANGYDPELPVPVVNVEGSIIRANVSYDHPLFLGKFLKKPTTPIAVTASAVPAFSPQRVEVALVLDNTESMSVAGKIDALQEAATALVDGVERSNSQSRISLVPFARYVNIGVGRGSEPWIDVPAPYETERKWNELVTIEEECNLVTETIDVDGEEVTLTREKCVATETETVERTITLRSRWDGCVGSRGPSLDLQDTASPAFQGMLNILPREESGLAADVWTRCPRAVIMPLTDNYDSLRTRISEMGTSDKTYLPGGIMWGYRTLTPGAPYSQSTGNVRQVMVVMSDGHNTTHLRSSQGTRADDMPPPYIAQTPDSDADMQTDIDTAAACQIAKDNDVEVFTVAFRINRPDARRVLRECATSPANALTANTNAQLVQAFASIKFGLEDSVRLSR